MTFERRVGETTVKNSIVESEEILLKLATHFMGAQSPFRRAAYVFGCVTYREAWGKAGGL